MADLVLKDGREITFDMNAFTIAEWRAIFKPEAPDDLDFCLIAKSCGMKEADVKNMGFSDFTKVKKVFIEKVGNPNPN